MGFLIAVPAAAEPLKLATDEWPPFRISGESGLTGLDIDFMQAVAKRVSGDLEVVQMPWGRALTSMQNGSADVMSGLAYRDERAEFISYTDTPYYNCTTAFYARQGEGQGIKTYEDLQNVPVGYVLHSAYFDRFDNDTALYKVGVAQESTLLDMLVHGRIPLMIGTDCQVDYIIQREGLSAQIEEVPYNPGNSVDLFLGVSKRSPWAEDMDRFNEVVRELIAEGFVSQSAEMYYGPES
ncbi:transporter substrate-binding domain-containing protein [Roseibium denhamense]|nr:transporter substrate-binding domain-containing protein [Roseibium denhamense]